MDTKQPIETDSVYQEMFDKFESQSEILRSLTNKLDQLGSEGSNNDTKYIISRFIKKSNVVLNYYNLIREQKEYFDKLNDRRSTIKKATESIEKSINILNKIIENIKHTNLTDTHKNELNNCFIENIDILFSIYNALKIANTIQRSHEALKRIESIEKAARLASGATADHEIASFFSELEIEYKTSSEEWLAKIQNIVIIIVLFIIFIDPIYSCLQKKNWIFFEGDLIKYSYFTTKISLIATLLIGLFFCIKNYNINKHNSIINKYKSVIMKTSPAFFLNILI